MTMRSLARLLVLGLIAVQSAVVLAGDPPPTQPVKEASSGTAGAGKADALAGADMRRPAAAEQAGITTVGDYFKFNTRVEGFRLSSEKKPEEIPAPKGSCFRVSQELDDPDNAGQKLARGIFVTGYLPRLLLPPYRCLTEDELQKSDPKIDPALSYDVARRMILEDRDRNRFGWTYGALVVPFKFYTGEREFSAGATVGPYLGYRLYDRQGSSSVLALGIGLATVDVTTNNPDGTASSSNTTGMSAALAYLLEIKGVFRVGAVAGADYFSRSQNIATSGKLWLGLSFGYQLE
jgi:hypothetical protein